MGRYLNSKLPFENYRSMVKDTYFVDKTDLISQLIPSLEKEKRFLCITRPRRFGKSVMANMIGAFFGKAGDGEEIFQGLAVSRDGYYHNHLNKHNIIFIDFSRMPRGCRDYASYIDRVQDGINQDLADAYPEVKHRYRRCCLGCPTDGF